MAQSKKCAMFKTHLALAVWHSPTGMPLNGAPEARNAQMYKTHLNISRNLWHGPVWPHGRQDMNYEQC